MIIYTSDKLLQILLHVLFYYLYIDQRNICTLTYVKLRATTHSKQNLYYLLTLIKIKTIIISLNLSHFYVSKDVKRGMYVKKCKTILENVDIRMSVELGRYNQQYQ